MATEPISAETSDAVANAIGKVFSAEARMQALHVSSDDPSVGMWRRLRKVLPNIQTLSLDATHLPIVYEYTSGWSA